MTARKVLPLILSCILCGEISNAQVGGLSASKLRTYSATVVDKRKIEFEPSVMITMKPIKTNDLTLNDVTGKSSTLYSSGMNFRFTYGALKGVETGLSTDVGLNTASFGTKILVRDKESWKSAIIAGVNLNGLNDIHGIYDTIIGFSHTYSAGSINTISLSENLSIDSDIQISRYFSGNFKNCTDLFFNCDMGFYTSDSFQVAAGLNYARSLSPLPGSHLMGEAGFTLETARQFLIVFNVPFTIRARNVQAYYGLSLALTMTFD